MKYFGARGFDSTNLPELLEAMGLSKSSLYETFGDKNKLFEEAIDLYIKEIAFLKVEKLLNASSVKVGFQAFFAEQIRCCTDGKFPGGCFLVNTAITLNNVPPPLAKKIRKSVEQMRALFLSQIQKGQKARGNTSGKRRFGFGLCDYRHIDGHERDGESEYARCSNAGANGRNNHEFYFWLM